VSNAQKILDVIVEAEQLLMKFSDGTVDPGDLDHLNRLIEQINGFLANGIQDLLDNPDAKEVISIVMLLLGMARSYLFWQAMRGK
jgi:hypothetical protein